MPNEAIIIGGPNGAGKSTFAGEFLRRRSYRFHNADEIAKALSPNDPAGAQMRAGRQFLKNVAESIERGEDVLIESTLSGLTFRRIMKDLRGAGYRISIVFVFLHDARMSVERVRERVRGGGHDVPTPDLLRRFNRSKSNFWNVYRLLADQWHLYYNSSKGRVEVAAGSRKQHETFDDDLLDLFLRDVDER